jgi:hypothetical protein
MSVTVNVNKNSKKKKKNRFNLDGFILHNIKILQWNANQCTNIKDQVFVLWAKDINYK